MYRRGDPASHLQNKAELRNWLVYLGIYQNTAYQQLIELLIQY